MHDCGKVGQLFFIMFGLISKGCCLSQSPEQLGLGSGKIEV